MSDDTRPRVPFLDSKNQIPEDQHHNFERIVESRGQVIGPFGVLLHSPEIAGRTGYLGTYVRFESDLPGDVRELAILVTSREHECPFEWAVHEPVASEEGVSESAIETVKNDESASELNDREEMIVRYGRELLRENEISDQVFDPVIETFGTTGATELTATFGYYTMLAVVLNALEVYPERNRPTYEE